jgi:hypothetical protein
MNSTIANQSAEEQSAGSGALNIAVVRSNLTSALQPVAGFCGSPANNIVGLCTLAEAIRASLGLPIGSVNLGGEMHTGIVWVNFGSLASSHVVAEILALLERIHQIDYFAVLVLDTREEFFRPYHQGKYAGDCAMVTLDQLASEIKAYQLRHSAKLAALEKALEQNNPPNPT